MLSSCLASASLVPAQCYACSAPYAMQNLLASWPGVKDVHPEQQVKRSLTWDSSIDSKAEEESQTDTAWVQKRPGRYAISAASWKRVCHVISFITWSLH